MARQHANNIDRGVTLKDRAKAKLNRAGTMFAKITQNAGLRHESANYGGRWN
jgi:hypothetical protein